MIHLLKNKAKIWNLSFAVSPVKNTKTTSDIHFFPLYQIQVRLILCEMKSESAAVTKVRISFLMKNYYVMGAAAKSVNPHLIDFQNCNIKHKTRSFKTTRRLDKSAALAESRLSASVKMRQTTGVTGECPLLDSDRAQLHYSNFSRWILLSDFACTILLLDKS